MVFIKEKSKLSANLFRGHGFNDGNDRITPTIKLSPTFSVLTRKFYNIGFFTPIEGSAGTENTLSFHQLSFYLKKTMSEITKL